MNIKQFIKYLVIMILPVMISGFIIKFFGGGNIFFGVVAVPIYLAFVIKFLKVRDKIENDWNSILLFLFSILIMMTFYEITFSGGMWAVCLGLRPNMTLDPGTRIIAISLSTIAFFLANIFGAICFDIFNKKHLKK